MAALLLCEHQLYNVFRSVVGSSRLPDLVSNDFTRQVQDPTSLRQSREELLSMT